MKRTLWLVAVVLALAACSSPVLTAATSPSPGGSPAAGTGPGPTTASTPTANGPNSLTPPAPSYGVLVDLLTDPQRYTVTLVDVDGLIAAQVQGLKRAPIATRLGHAVTLPYVSSSRSALYYLDGDSSVYRRGLDGTVRPVAHLQVGAGMEATFAVSPDDSSIAVALLDFNQTPVHLTLYTQALSGDVRHVIFESDTDYVWPVAWHGGLLVLGHAYGPYEEDVARAAPGRDNPYSAISYHLVDPANGYRKVLMGSCTVSGPLSPAGSGCIQGGSIDWQGHTTDWTSNNWGTISSAAALSPDGRWMAATRPDQQNEMAIWRPTGEVANYVDGPGALDWAGWLDDETVLTGSYVDPSWQPQVTNVMHASYVHTVAAHGFVAGLLPTNVF